MAPRRTSSPATDPRDLRVAVEALNAAGEQSPVHRGQQGRHLLLNQLAGRQSGARVGQPLARPLGEHVLDAQAELLDVEGLGDVVVDAQLQAGDAIAALVLLREEDDRHVAGARAGAKARQTS